MALGVLAVAAAVLLVFVAAAMALEVLLVLRYLGSVHIVTTGWTVTCRCGLIAFGRCWIVVGWHGGNYNFMFFGHRLPATYWSKYGEEIVSNF
eukprot:scaffold8181_cov116-Skeletonema_dohrnii-CCMP3373.AAC.1